MTAVRALLDAKTSVRRTARRRKLRLQAQRSAASGAANVLILNVSTTGLLLAAGADLTEGETFELDIPEAAGVPALVKWTSGQLFGCQFKEPISSAAVSALLLRAPYEPPSSRNNEAQADIAGLAANVDEPGRDKELSFAARMRWIIGLALLSWAGVAAAVALAWRYLQ
ncbi:MAG: PilZ domain-containing protein [Sphingomonas sp.]|jgi:hypothetical protein